MMAVRHGGPSPARRSGDTRIAPSPAQRLMSMARECRQLSQAMADAGARGQMALLADCFARLARVREEHREERWLPECADD